MEAKFSAGLWIFSGPSDRFNPGGYGESLSPLDQIKLAGRAEGLEGLELHWPTDFNGPSWEGATVIIDENVEAVKAALKEAGLVPTCLNVNTFGFKEWGRGAFTHRDDNLRKRAIECAQRAVEVSKMIGCPTVGLWLGADGFDYPFQVDYSIQWERLVDGIRQVAEADKDVRVSLEYKLKEPRTHMQIGTVGKALYICSKIPLENLGVTVDFGHALMGGENPADSACLLAREGKLFNVHFNDAYRYWDDDMMVGVVNFWETVEFLYHTMRTGYSGYYGLDMYPFREDPVRCVELSIGNLKSMIRMAERIDDRALEKAQATMDAVATQEIVRRLIYE